MKIVAIIPARFGSRSIKNKNIAMVNGHPLIAYTIAVCKQSKLIDEVVVSTDSKKIASISKKYKAKVPFLRPKNISKNISKDYDFFNHYLEFLKRKKLAMPDLLIHARPTTPFRDLSIFNKGINFFLKNKGFTSMRSVHETYMTPFKLFKLQKKQLIGFFPRIKGDYYNLPRQSFAKTFVPNGYIDLVKPEIVKNKILHGKKILSYKTEEIIDIDGPSDLKKALIEVQKKKYKKLLNYLNKLIK